MRPDYARRTDFHRSSSGRASRIALFALLAYVPYSFYLHDKMPARLLGISVWATFIPSLLLISAFFAAKGWNRRTSLWVYGLFGTAAVVLLRWWIYDDQPFVTIRGARWLVLVPMALVATHRVLGEARARVTATRIVVVNTVVAGLIGLAYASGLFTYRVIGLDVGGGRAIEGVVPLETLTRASGLMSSPNVYAGFLVLGIVLVSTVSKVSMPWGLFANALLMAGIVASGSRAAFIVGTLTVIFYLLRWSSQHRTQRPLRLVAIIAVLLLAGGTLTTLTSTVIDRFDENFGLSRWEKAEYSASVLAGSPAAFLLGPQRDSLIDEDRGINVSDNTVTLVLLSVGVPLAMVFAAVIVSLIRAAPSDRTAGRNVVLLALVVVLLANNAFLWDFWLVYAAAIYWIIVFDSRSTGTQRGLRTTAIMTGHRSSSVDNASLTEQQGPQAGL